MTIYTETSGLLKFYVKSTIIRENWLQLSSSVIDVAIFGMLKVSMLNLKHFPNVEALIGTLSVERNRYCWNQSSKDRHTMNRNLTKFPI